MDTKHSVPFIILGGLFSIQSMNMAFVVREDPISYTILFWIGILMIGYGVYLNSLKRKGIENTKERNAS